MPAINTNHSVNDRLTRVAINTTGTNVYLADEIAPAIIVDKIEGEVYKIDPGAVTRRAHDAKRAPGTEANRVDVDVEVPISYRCEDSAFDWSKTDEEEGTEDDIVAEATPHVEILSDMIMLGRDISLAATIGTAMVSASKTTTPDTKWDNSSGTPITDIRTRMLTIRTASGVMPNRLAVDSAILSGIMKSAEWKEMFRNVALPGAYQGSFDVAANALASAVGIEKVVFTPCAVKNTAAQGATPAFADIWGPNALLYHVGPPSSKYRGTFASMVWVNPKVVAGGTAAGSGGNRGGWRTFRYRKDNCEAWVTRVGRHFQDKIMNLDTAWQFLSVLT